MKLKNFFIRVILIGCLFSFLNCSHGHNTDKLIIVQDLLGVKTGNVIKFYQQYSDAPGWLSSKEVKDFVLPSDANHLITLEDHIIGVEEGNTLKFYEGDNNWQLSAKAMPFEIPSGTDELITFGNDNVIGVRKGKVLSFYALMHREGWVVARGRRDFNIPSDVDKLITVNGKVGVMQNKIVKFYEPFRGWQLSDRMSDFNVPADAEELTSIGRLICVRHGNLVRFYDSQANWNISKAATDFNISN